MNANMGRPAFLVNLHALVFPCRRCATLGMQCLRGAVKHAGRGVERLTSAVRGFGSSSQHFRANPPPWCTDADPPKVLITGSLLCVNIHVFLFFKIKSNTMCLLPFCSHRRTRPAGGGARQVAEVSVYLSSDFKCLSWVGMLVFRPQETLWKKQRDSFGHQETPQPRRP